MSERLFLVPASIEVILVALSRNAAVVDSVHGTVVITGQTTGTFPIVKPRGRCTFNIVNRAHLTTFATAGACVTVHSELLVSNHLLVEVGADDVGVESGSGAFLQFFDAPFAVFDDADDVVQLVSGILDLPMFFVYWVGLHEWQTDI